MDQNNFDNSHGEKDSNNDNLNEHYPSSLPIGEPNQPKQQQDQIPNNLPGQQIPKPQEEEILEGLPEQQPIIQPPQRQELPQNKPIKVFRSNTKSNKSTAIVAIVITAIVIILVSAVIIFGGGDDTNNNEAPEVILPNSETTEVPEQPAPVMGLEMDSILRSSDNGLSFEPYFFLVTDESHDLVDVLNISFHPQNDKEIIVSTYNNGLFVNVDSNENKWQKINFPPQKIYSFILDKFNPSSRSFASGVVSENGRIFRTNDGGDTWNTVYAEPGNRTYVSALTQDPVNQDIIIAGTSGGTLIRSLDGGDTWNNIGQDIRGKINQFTHDAVGTSLTYLLEKGGDIYHSNDSGLNWLEWEEIKDEEIKDLNYTANELRKAGNKTGYTQLRERAAALKEKNKTGEAPSGIITIIADPNRTGVLYAGLKKGLYRSVDYGKYWEQLNIIESAEKFPITSIAVNPDNSDEISFVAGSSFYRSVNNGVTWAVTPLDKTRNASFVAYDPFDTNVIYIGLSAQK